MKTYKLHRLLLISLDIILIAFGLAASYQLRFDFRVPADYKLQYLYVVSVVVIIRIVILMLLGLYRGVLRYASINEMLAVFASAVMGTLFIFMFNILIEHTHSFKAFPLTTSGENLLRIPWGIIFFEGVLFIVLIGGERLSRRVMLLMIYKTNKSAKRVLIVGVNDKSVTAVSEMSNQPTKGHIPVAFIAEDENIIGSRIHDLKVAGSLKDIPDVIEEFNIDEILIALQNPDGKIISDIINISRKSRVAFKILPGVYDFMENVVSVNTIRPVGVEDLLGRDPVILSLDDNKNYIKDKCVLVTGAGGSIGSELSRQIIGCKPSKLLLLGRGENSIYQIQLKLSKLIKDNNIIPIIADVQDYNKLEYIFQQYKPQVIFHTAAHKHVPLMEANPEEAVKNNIFGTKNTAELADKYGAEKFVFISTDKAVRPTSVMGATKRISEILINSCFKDSKTKFMSVRFGNVLDSRGSVIPLFKSQIESGGPITITHPDIIRYFMTIPEAAALVIQAGAIGENGQLFLLDMGKPVKILDLATNLITLYGLRPGDDIEIVFTGLRPGEKLYEELLTDQEGAKKTSFEKIFVTDTEKFPKESLYIALDNLKKSSETLDINNIFKIFKELIVSYNPEQKN